MEISHSWHSRDETLRDFHVRGNDVQGIKRRERALEWELQAENFTACFHLFRAFCFLHAACVWACELCTVTPFGKQGNLRTNAQRYKRTLALRERNCSNSNNNNNNGLNLPLSWSFCLEDLDLIQSKAQVRVVVDLLLVNAVWVRVSLVLGHLYWKLGSKTVWCDPWLRGFQ